MQPKKKEIVFFILNCIAMALFLFAFCFGLIMPQYGGNYQAAMVDKVARLKQTPGERIVLIGNSNLAFGMNSELLEQELGRPVINMGLHGGTGNCFNERAALLDIHPGDLYVFCETNYDDADRIKNPELAWITIEDHFQLYPLIRPVDWPDMIRAYPTYLGKCLTFWRTGTGNEELTNSYRRSAFNERGDNYYPRPVSEENIDFTPATINHINEESARRLNGIYEKLKAKGADMVIAAYPIPLWEEVPSADAYRQMQQEIDDALEAEVISDFTAYRYDTSYFYDTHAHLTDAGVYVRTKQLAEDIRMYMEEEK